MILIQSQVEAWGTHHVFERGSGTDQVQWLGRVEHNEEGRSIAGRWSSLLHFGLTWAYEKEVFVPNVGDLNFWTQSEEPAAVSATQRERTWNAGKQNDHERRKLSLSKSREPDMSKLKDHERTRPALNKREAECTRLTLTKRKLGMPPKWMITNVRYYLKGQVQG